MTVSSVCFITLRAKRECYDTILAVQSLMPRSQMDVEKGCGSNLQLYYYDSQVGSAVLNFNI